MARGVEGHPHGSGHSNQTASKFSSRGTWAGHDTSSSAPGMEHKEAGIQPQPRLPLLAPSWARSR